MPQEFYLQSDIAHFLFSHVKATRFKYAKTLLMLEVYAKVTHSGVYAKVMHLVIVLFVQRHILVVGEFVLYGGEVHGFPDDFAVSRN